MAAMRSSTILLLLTSALLSFCFSSEAVEVSYDGRALTINGHRKIILSGSIHYPRSTPEMWPDLIKKAKEGGLNTIETYVFWNAHEPQRRQYDFSGRNDLMKFINYVKKAGLYLILRIGPYVCAEWNYGGFPVWLHNMPGIEFRTDNKVFQDEMAIFTSLIVNMVKENHYFASQGGPIILAQIENEYGNVMSSYGDAGKRYIQWCAKLAQSLNIGVPWIMCQQDDAPAPMIPTCNGYYCDSWYPKSNNVPKMWTENWTGWYKSWGSKDPHRTAEDLAFAVARFFQYGGTLQNYYMYHGGTNYGRSAGGPYITTSYDYDAPLDEYGNYNQPKWGHLKKLHEVLKSVEEALTYGVTENYKYPNFVDVQMYSYNGQDVCFMGNANDSYDATISFRNREYFVPAWSVTILTDCVNPVYNTARVNVQTSIMVKEQNPGSFGQEEPFELDWHWTNEHIEHFQRGGAPGGSILTTNKLLDQKVVTNDTSDYLWYLTRFDHPKSELVTLRVNTDGHVVHVFVNNKFMGTQYAQNGHYSFTYEIKIKLRKGKNYLTLCSSTVGLANYGAYVDNVPVGIKGVQIVYGTDGTVTRDLSTNQWVYKVGLLGETKKLFDVSGLSDGHRWRTELLSSSEQFIWYKTSFKTPPLPDPVVVDLKGMGKGHAWVNGYSIGRFWPSYKADKCDDTQSCDYRGTYGAEKCTTNCGESTQRWYHIPRQYLRDEENTLVLFEEIRGSPYSITIQTVTVGKICADASEGSVLELSCQGGRIINEVKFVSFGMPHGSCGAFEKGACESASAFSYVQQQCLYKDRCSINVNETALGLTSCYQAAFDFQVQFTGNQLAVEMECADPNF